MSYPYKPWNEFHAPFFIDTQSEYQVVYDICQKHSACNRFIEPIARPVCVITRQISPYPSADKTNERQNLQNKIRNIIR